MLTDFNCINSDRIGVLDELGIRSGVFGYWDDVFVNFGIWYAR